jgi:uncharacterized 2Fe-2S/4Fe-4S cluster protein (DUF4445 family)
MPKREAERKAWRIDFEPVGRRAQCEPGQTLLEAAHGAGVEIVSLCGGVGLCDSCRVRIIAGEVSPPNLIEQERFTEAELAAGFRLACQTEPRGEVKIDIPAESLTTPQRLQIEGQAWEVELAPAVVGLDLRIDPPSLTDLRSDLTRLKDALRATGVSNPSLTYPLLRDLSEVLRGREWSLRAAVRGSEVISLRSEGAALHGLAIDLGTTKLAAYLIDLGSGETLAKGGAMNPQIAYGEDVVSRIAYCNAHEGGRELLQRAVIDRLNDLVADLCREAGTARERILEAVVVGNTAMHHLFTGLPVRQLGASPYVPTVGEALELRAADLGLALDPNAYVYLPPNIAGYVGADHVAMLLATRIWERDRVELALDIGTNTEITVGVDGRLLSCSCASGPAFEGAHILDGMRAAPGAIERVGMVDGEVSLQTIGGSAPVGICGSGILDAIATMLNAGIVDRRGALSTGDERVRDRDGEAAFVLSPASETGHGRDVVVTRRDVNEIQLAKGAIRTGIDILLDEAGIAAEDLESFLVAGAFGTYIDVNSAIDVGMFPRLPLERFHQVGNAAGAGARELLVSGPMRAEVERILDRLEYIELTTHPEFQDRFMESLYF